MSYQPILPDGMESFRDVFSHSEDSQLPDISVSGIQTIREAGFLKLGYGYTLEDQLGRIFLVHHAARAVNNVADDELGIPSETVKGKVVDEELVGVEGIASCLVRCLKDEQGIDLREAPDGAKLMLSRIHPIVTINWLMTHRNSEVDDETENYGDSTFGLVTTLRANSLMSNFIAVNAKKTHEAETGFFTPLDAIRKYIASDRPYRASFDKVFDLHLLHTPALPEISWEQLEIPTDLDHETGEWVGLRFNNLTDRWQKVKN